MTSWGSFLNPNFYDYINSFEDLQIVPCSKWNILSSLGQCLGNSLNYSYLFILIYPELFLTFRYFAIILFGMRNSFTCFCLSSMPFPFEISHRKINRNLRKESHQHVFCCDLQLPLQYLCVLMATRKIEVIEISLVKNC